MGLVHATLVRATAVFILAAAAIAGGCSNSSPLKVPVEGLRIPPEYAPAIEITNWQGDVQVYASDKFKDIQVRARARALDKTAPRRGEDLRKCVAVRAVSSQDGDRRLLKITSRPAASPPQSVAVDLQIRIPRAMGIHVVNSGGEVELIGVGGPITVENGAPGQAGGPIQVRTGVPMTEPVTLRTTSGKIVYQVGPGSTASFDLKTASGSPEVTAEVGSLDRVSAQPQRWRGTLDRGTNPVQLSTDKGDVSVLVIENAATYGREYWDGWPEWPSSPRWIAKLGGE